jgi:hypothetical protein
VLQAFCAAVGLTLYLTRPDFYSDYLTDLLGKSEDWAIYARLQSYWGSTGVGILSATSIALLPVTGLQRQMRYFLLFLFLATILLAQQRGAYISGVAAAAYFIYRERVSWTYLLLGVLGMTAVGVLVLAKSGVTTDMVIAIIDNRVVFDLFEGDPYGERSVSWAKGLDFLMRFPLGLGLGATTSAATDAGAHVDGQVVDAYYMRVASDLGVAGLALFVLLLAVAFTTAIRNRATWAYAVIVFIFAFQSTGTNVLDSYYVAHVFWMLLGFLSVRSVRDCVVAGIGAPSVRSAY